MASKSGGTIPAQSMIADANQAIAILDQMYHWNSTVVSGQGRRGYSITITNAGKRVTAQRSTFIGAAAAALAKLRGTEKPKMRLAI